MSESTIANDSIEVSIKEYYLGSSQISLTENWDLLLYLLLGAFTCFLIVAANKFYFFFDQKEDLSNDDTSTKQKFEHIDLIWWRRLRSLTFRICVGYGMIASMLFLGIFLIEFTSDISLVVSKNLALKTNNRLIDLMFAGFIFALITYPVISAKILGKYGLDWLIDLIARPKDGRILDDIDNEKLAYIRKKIQLLDEKIKKQNPNGMYGKVEFKYHITTWNDHKKKP